MLVDDLISCEAIRFGDFTLTSGKKSSYYIDVKKACSRPDILAKIIDCFVDKGVDCSKVAGVELGAVPLIVGYSLRTGKPFLIIRKKAKEHGTGRRMEGEVDHLEEEILLLEDVVTSGGSVLSAIDVIEEAGGKVTAVMAVVDREEGGTERIEQRAEFISLVRASELLGRDGWMEKGR